MPNRPDGTRLDCGCKIVPVDDRVEPCDLCSEATGMSDNVGWVIEHCPAHKASLAAGWRGGPGG